MTSSTLMANSNAYAAAIEMAQRNPKLAVGCHVVLIDGAPVLPVEDVSSLLAGQRFRSGFVDFARAARGGRLDGSEIHAEAAAQIRKLQQSGIALTHIDSHKHVHMFAAVLRPLLEAACDCGVRAVRNPFPPARPLAYAHLLRRPRLWTRYTEVKILAAMKSGFLREAQRNGMRTTDGTFGVVSTGALDAKLFEAIVGCIPEGTWEFVCHPGYNDPELDKVQTRLRGSRVKEMEVLTSPEARRVLERRGIELITYRELAG